ncbi:MAG: hypothetical protein Q8P18_04490 [Pseudomonadota bacterium]|nr:hypothetical protein [Pseudomonadota bacterium]
MSGSWSRLHDVDGREVRLTRQCAADNQFLVVSSDTLIVEWGQETATWEIRRTAEHDGGLILNLTLADGEEADLHVRRDGRVWVWTGSVVGGTWRTPMKDAEFPAMKQCCTSTADEPVEDQYALVDDAADCPPEP